MKIRVTEEMNWHEDVSNKFLNLLVGYAMEFQLKLEKIKVSKIKEIIYTFSDGISIGYSPNDEEFLENSTKISITSESIESLDLLKSKIDYILKLKEEPKTRPQLLFN